VILTIYNWPPTVNHYYVTTRNGARVMTKAAKVWMIVAVLELKSQMRNNGFVTIRVPCKVRLDFHQPDLVRFDVDNRAKACLDALQQSQLIEDDALVVELTLTKERPPTNDSDLKAWRKRPEAGTVDITLVEI